MNHEASPDFWTCYEALPTLVQELADRAFDLLKVNPLRPSPHLKKVGRFWSARVGLRHRAFAVESPQGLIWFWIKTHVEYDKLIG